MPDTQNKDLPNLSGQLAVVTGGGRGIGKVISQTLAQAGASVAVLGRSPEPLAQTVSEIETAGGRAAAFELDVTSGEDVVRVMTEVEAALGEITLLVNNAGIGESHAPLHLADPEVWWRDIEVNLRGPFLCTHAALQSMVKRGKGRIVNMASNVALWPNPQGSYSTSKAALIRLTDCTAASIADDGLSAFAISPGWVWTDMTRATEKMMRKNILGFNGIDDAHVYPPEAAANLITRLASGEADALTGRYIHVGDNLDDMIATADKIVSDDTYQLRLAQ